MGLDGGLGLAPCVELASPTLVLHLMSIRTRAERSSWMYTLEGPWSLYDPYTRVLSGVNISVVAKDGVLIELSLSRLSLVHRPYYMRLSRPYAILLATRPVYAGTLVVEQDFSVLSE